MLAALAILLNNPSFSAYKNAKKQFRQALRQHRRSTNDKFFSYLDLESDLRGFFCTVCNLVSPSSQHPPTNHITHEGTPYSNSSILDRWASYFRSLSKPSETQYNLDHLETLKSLYELLELANSSEPDPDPPVVTAEEISTIIQELPLRKAAGPDQLVNEHLLHAGPILPSILAIIFNSILLSGHVPSAFRHGLIIPIPKGPNKDCLFHQTTEDYASIHNKFSLRESYINCLTHQIAMLHPLQGGFRQNLDCIHTAFVLNEAISSSLELKLKTLAAFLDVQKAFTPVWHQGLMVKFAELIFPKYIWSILNNWYNDLSSSVLWYIQTSVSFAVHQVVHQVAVHSPLLYFKVTIFEGTNV